MKNSQQNFNLRKVNNKPETNFNLEKTSKWDNLFALGRKRSIKIGIIAIIVFLIILSIFLFLRSWSAFSKGRVDINIISPEKVASGRETEIEIKIDNNNRIDLRQAELTIDYPEASYSLTGQKLNQETIAIGDILAKDSFSQKVKVRLTGEIGSLKLLTTQLEYQPENISSYYQDSTSTQIEINSVLIGLYLSAPQQAVSGEEISFSINYQNSTDNDFSNLKLEVNYPVGFTLKEANPVPEATEDKNTWLIGGLAKNERGVINISGLLEGDQGENKTIEVTLGEVKENDFLQYSQTSSIVQISDSPLAVSLALSGVTSDQNLRAGQKLTYLVDFQNNTDIALSQLILKIYPQGEMFDLNNLTVSDRGFFDSLNNVITWSAAGVSNLALLLPGQKGEVKFSVPLKKTFPIYQISDKNFEVKIRAELETLNVPLEFNLAKLNVSQELTKRINSSIFLGVKGYYHESNSRLQNSGPIPPRVNQQTTYTIHWQVANNTNDLKDLRIIAVLPQGIEWQNNYLTTGQNSQVQYNERTKQIVWQIDNLTAATGILSPVTELIFQIALRPSVTQVQTTPVLIDESHLEATDIFTGETIEAFGQALATDLPDDQTVSTVQGQVMQ